MKKIALTLAAVVLAGAVWAERPFTIANQPTRIQSEDAKDTNTTVLTLESRSDQAVSFLNTQKGSNSALQIIDSSGKLMSSNLNATALPALNGNALTNLNPTNFASGRLAALNANALTNLNPSNFASGKLAALNGESLTNLGAANLAAGGSLPALNAASLTNINPSNLTAGLKLSAMNAESLTNVNPSNLTAGLRLSAMNAESLTNIKPAGLAGAGAFTGYVTSWGIGTVTNNVRYSNGLVMTNITL